MWLHSTNLFEFDPPISQNRVPEKRCKCVVVDRLYLRHNESAQFAQLGHEILKLAKTPEVFGIGAIFRQLERGKVVKPFNLQIELLLEFQKFGQRLGRFSHPTFPLSDF